MDDQYYYLLDGKEQGPFSKAAIQSLVANGALASALFRTYNVVPRCFRYSKDKRPAVDSRRRPRRFSTSRDGVRMQSNANWRMFNETPSRLRTTGQRICRIVAG